MARSVSAATTSGTGAEVGYSSEIFLSPVPEDLKCGSCTQVAREALLTDCCGEVFCKACIVSVAKSCPLCGEESFMTVANKRDQRKIAALEVRCANHEQGCEWTGRLEQFDAHYSECKSKGQPESDMDWNARTASAMKEMERRLEESIQKQVLSMRDVLQEKIEQKEKRIEQLEAKLRDKDEQLGSGIQEQLAEKDKQIQELRAQSVQDGQNLKKIAEQTGAVEAKLAQLEGQLHERGRIIEELRGRSGVPPYLFIMPNFNWLKSTSSGWYSPVLFTHPNGYKLCVSVWPNGYIEGKGTHISVALCRMAGEHDGWLRWPAECTITLKLLNQHRDQDHIAVSKFFRWERPDNLEPKPFANFSRQFVAHGDLELRANTRTQYLKSNCLKVKITEIQVHSVYI